jgi:hypothetical protein
VSGAKDSPDTMPNVGNEAGHVGPSGAHSETIDTVRDEALRKIGRNVVNFQKMEAMLRVLSVPRSISGSLSELKVLATRARKTVAKKSMGSLVEAFVSSAFSAQPELGERALAEEVAVSFSFRIDANQEISKERKKALRAVVAERNKLVHGWLAEFDSRSMDSCLRLSAELDAQHARIMPEFEALVGIFRAFTEFRAAMARCIASDEFMSAISGDSASESEVSR